MGAEFDRLRVAHRLESSLRIVHWAYQRMESTGGLTWRRRNELIPLSSGWLSRLAGGGRG